MKATLQSSPNTVITWNAQAIQGQLEDQDDVVIVDCRGIGEIGIHCDDCGYWVIESLDKDGCEETFENTDLDLAVQCFMDIAENYGEA